MKMKAAILFEAGASQPYAESRPLRVEEVDLEGPHDNEVLVRIGGAGLCHSDLSVINASIPRALPMVMGHEGSGEIVDVGKNVNDVEVGDHVVFQFRTSCGRCRRCAEGRPALCEISAKAKATGGLIGGGSRLSFRRSNPSRIIPGSRVWPSTQLSTEAQLSSSTRNCRWTKPPSSAAR